MSATGGENEWYERERAAFIVWWESEGQKKFGETPTIAAGAGWLARAEAASTASETVEPMPCETCNDDPEVCATVPGLRHCAAAVRANETPRTNDATRNARSLDYEENGEVVLADFARGLERELAAMQIAYAALATPSATPTKNAAPQASPGSLSGEAQSRLARSPVVAAPHDKNGEQDHGGIYPRTGKASLVCACGVMVPQDVCNDMERELDHAVALGRASLETLTTRSATLDTERLNWLEKREDGFANIDRITSESGRFNRLPTLREAIDKQRQYVREGKK